MLEGIVADFYLFLEGFRFRDLSTFAFLLGRSASWLDSVSVRFDSLLLGRRRGRLNPREFHGVLLLDFGGLQDFENVDFLVIPRPECQLAGLVSPRDSVVAHLSNN